MQPLLFRSPRAPASAIGSAPRVRSSPRAPRDPHTVPSPPVGPADLPPQRLPVREKVSGAFGGRTATTWVVSPAPHRLLALCPPGPFFRLGFLTGPASGAGHRGARGGRPPLSPCRPRSPAARSPDPGKPPGTRPPHVGPGFREVLSLSPNRARNRSLRLWFHSREKGGPPRLLRRRAAALVSGVRGWRPRAGLEEARDVSEGRPGAEKGERGRGARGTAVGVAPRPGRRGARQAAARARWAAGPGSSGAEPTPGPAGRRPPAAVPTPARLAYSAGGH